MGLGLVPMGLAFGMLVTHTGLPWWSAPVFSAVLYTGALEFLLTLLVTAVAALATQAVIMFTLPTETTPPPPVPAANGGRPSAVHDLDGRQSRKN